MSRDKVAQRHLRRELSRVRRELVLNARKHSERQRAFAGGRQKRRSPPFLSEDGLLCSVSRQATCGDGQDRALTPRNSSCPGGDDGLRACQLACCCFLGRPRKERSCANALMSSFHVASPLTNMLVGEDARGTDPRGNIRLTPPLADLEGGSALVAGNDHPNLSEERDFMRWFHSDTLICRVDPNTFHTWAVSLLWSMNR